MINNKLFKGLPDNITLETGKFEIIGNNNSNYFVVSESKINAGNL